MKGLVGYWNHFFLTEYLVYIYQIPVSKGPCRKTKRSHDDDDATMETTKMEDGDEEKVDGAIKSETKAEDTDSEHGDKVNALPGEEADVRDVIYKLETLASH